MPLFTWAPKTNFRSLTNRSTQGRSKRSGAHHSKPPLLALATLVLVACIPLGVLVWKRVQPGTEASSSPVAALEDLEAATQKYRRAALQPASAHGMTPRAVTRTIAQHEIQPGETVHTIAQRYGMNTSDLELLNPAVARFIPGTRVKVWTQHHATGDQEGALGLNAIRVPTQGISHGRSNGGWLEDGVQMPKLDHLYLRAQPHEQYGTSTVVNHIIDAVVDLRKRHGYRGQIVIGDLSIEHGGLFPPHKSHQSGRDADIWLPVRGSRQEDRRENMVRPHAEQADWLATWMLIDSLIATGAIHKIFLSYHLQEHLHAAAVRYGESKETLRRLIQYPHRHPEAIVRHSPSHTRHIHVRFRCSFRDRHQGRPSCQE